MADIHPDHDTPQAQILVLGEGRLIDVVRRVLDDAAADVVHLHTPTDRDIRRALTPDIDAVVVISRDDRISLRLALVVEGVRPGVRLIVTIYTATSARRCAAPSATCGSCRWPRSWRPRWRVTRVRSLPSGRRGRSSMSATLKSSVP